MKILTGRLQMQVWQVGLSHPHVETRKLQAEMNTDTDATSRQITLIYWNVLITPHISLTKILSENINFQFKNLKLCHFLISFKYKPIARRI